jgi:hypothetical protein
MARLKPEQRQVLKALEALGGIATTRQVAAATGLSVNGVSQRLGALSDRSRGYVTATNVPGSGGDQEWRRVPEVTLDSGR